MRVGDVVGQSSRRPPSAAQGNVCACVCVWVGVRGWVWVCVRARVCKAVTYARTYVRTHARTHVCVRACVEYARGCLMRRGSQGLKLESVSYIGPTGPSVRESERERKSTLCRPRVKLESVPHIGGDARTSRAD